MGNDVHAIITAQTIGPWKRHEPRPAILDHAPRDLIEFLVVALPSHNLKPGFRWSDRIRRAAFQKGG